LQRPAWHRNAGRFYVRIPVFGVVAKGADRLFLEFLIRAKKQTPQFLFWNSGVRCQADYVCLTCRVTVPLPVVGCRLQAPFGCDLKGADVPRCRREVQSLVAGAINGPRTPWLWPLVLSVNVI